MKTLPWETGAIARAAGIGRDRNPYRCRGRTAARAWERGWDHEDRQLAGEAGEMNAGDGLGKEGKARA